MHDRECKDKRFFNNKFRTRIKNLFSFTREFCERRKRELFDKLLYKLTEQNKQNKF